MTDLPVATGDRVQFTKTVGETDVYLFAGISGDFAANHVNQAHMEGTVYGGRIAHGALMVAYISAASTRLCERMPPNPALVPVNLGFDRIRFVGPVRIGDTVTVDYRVTGIDRERRRATCRAEVTNQKGETVTIADNVLKWVAASV